MWAQGSVSLARQALRRPSEQWQERERGSGLLVPQALRLISPFPSSLLPPLLLWLRRPLSWLQPLSFSPRTVACRFLPSFSGCRSSASPGARTARKCQT